MCARAGQICPREFRLKKVKKAKNSSGLRRFGASSLFRGVKTMFRHVSNACWDRRPAWLYWAATSWRVPPAAAGSWRQLWRGLLLPLSACKNTLAASSHYAPGDATAKDDLGGAAAQTGRQLARG